MRPWMIMFGGLVVWTAHFFLLYIIGSVFGTTAVARFAVTLLTLAAAGVIVLLLLRLRHAKDAPGQLSRWKSSLGLATAALSLIAVLWQGLPAILA